MLSVELLPAAHGDAIWIEYGAKAPLRRVLIDGGPAPTYASALRKRIGQLAEKRSSLRADRRHPYRCRPHRRRPDPVAGVCSAETLDRRDLVQRMEPAAQVERDTYAPLQGEFLGGVIEVDDKLNRGLEQDFRPRSGRRTRNGRVSRRLPWRTAARSPCSDRPCAELKRLRARWVSAIRDFSPGDAGEAVRRLRERREYRPPATPAVFAARDYGDDRTPGQRVEHRIRVRVRGDAPSCLRATRTRERSPLPSRAWPSNAGRSRFASTRSSCRITAAWATSATNGSAWSTPRTG